MRLLSFLFLLLTFETFKLSAAPASGRPIRITDPNGQQVEVVAVGDEHSRHFFFAESGEPVSWLPSVVQRIGVQPIKSGLQVFNAAHSRRTDGDSPAPKFLVILVDFPDRPFTTGNPAEAFQEIMNSNEMPARGSYASAKKYYEEQSNGIFQPQFDVVGPITMSQNAVHYASVGIDDSPTGQVVQEACQQIEDQIDFTEYDLDGNGVCDNIYIFFAGKGQADGGGLTTIWPHSARMDADWGISLVVDGVKISNYACSAELNGSGAFSGIGTFCHEFCHVLGLPDLYYTGVPHPSSFSLMASGNYNGNGYYPPKLSVYERFALGWVEPEEITQSQWITLTPSTDDVDSRIVKTVSENEYFLLENRQREGWDLYLPGHGLLVWHIDFDQEAWNNNVPNADRNHQRVYLVRADNNLNGYPNAASPFPGTKGVETFDATTTPAFLDWNGNPVDCALSTIAETPSGNITFRAETSNAAIDRIEADGIGSWPDSSEVLSNPWASPNSSATPRIFTLDGRELLVSSSLPRGIYLQVNPTGVKTLLQIP